MKKLLIFVIIVFGCSEEYEIKKLCNPFRMTISDAIPIQFWVNGVETYNQKEVCGITPACFCQPFNADDEIRIQFQDSDPNPHYLTIIDDSGSEIENLPITQIASGVWQIDFTFGQFGITSENVRLRIDSNSLTISTTAQEAGYTNSSGFGNDWNLTSDPPSVGYSVAPNTSQVSEFLYKSISPFSIGDTVDIHSIIGYSFAPGAGGGQVFITGSIAFLDVSFNVLGNENILLVPVTGVGGAGTQDETNSLVVPVGTIYISVNAQVGAIGGISNANASVSINTFESDSFEAAQSDCIDVIESHDCTVLIRYLNSKNYAGIDYSNLSPNAEFYLRIPAIFFHEVNPTEEERFETSGQTTVRLRDEIKVKKNLQVGYMPDYMHRKLLLVLAHDTVEIDGEEWVRSDPYEKVPPANKRYPLKMANVLLTLQGYIKRNIL